MSLSCIKLKKNIEKKCVNYAVNQPHQRKRTRRRRGRDEKEEEEEEEKKTKGKKMMMIGVLDHDSPLLRLYWAGDNLGE